jgi:hypothetical protein
MYQPQAYREEKKRIAWQSLLRICMYQPQAYRVYVPTTGVPRGEEKDSLAVTAQDMYGSQIDFIVDGGARCRV